MNDVDNVNVKHKNTNKIIKEYFTPLLFTEKSMFKQGKINSINTANNKKIYPQMVYVSETLMMLMFKIIIVKLRRN